MRKWSLFGAFVTALVVGACSDTGGGGISVDSACEVFCGTLVDCTVENEVDEDNVMQGCMTTCRDQIDVIESDHPDDEECEQATREYYRCLGAEASCDEFESQMFDEDTCRSEAFDIPDFCENYGG